MTAPVPLGHIGLTVSDVEAAAGWYCTVFGWRRLMGPVDVTTDDPSLAEQLRDVFDRPSVAFRQAHLEMPGNIALELFQFSDPPTLGPARFAFWAVGIFHLAVVDPDIQVLADRIEDYGGQRRTAIQPIFPGEEYLFCYCQDPDGNIIELATHPHTEAFANRSAYIPRVS